MTDITNKEQVQQAPKAYFVSDGVRKRTSQHNTSTHFAMGGHSLVRHSTTKLSTMVD
jgi:hypothetical protein